MIEGSETKSTGYVRYILLLLMLSYALNFLDRQIVNILAESIKRDMRISDTQLGLLTGTAFGLFYSILGVPIARLADRTSRVKVLSGALTIWSGFTIMCGFTTSYVQLFLARLGVGVGEAGGTPPAQSLISDYFPYERRATALAVFGMGLPLGSAAGFYLGGYFDQLLGWRHTLLLAGVPGILLAILIRMTLHEPVRGAADGLTETRSLTTREALKTLLRLKTFVRTASGGACAILIIYVTNAWLPPFFIRLHGMSVYEIGTVLALCISVGGTVSVLLGGVIADRMRRRFARSEIWVSAGSMLITFVTLMVLLLAESTAVALGAMFVMYTFGYVFIAPTNSLAQRVAPVRSRSLASGLLLLVGNIVSLTIGPPLVGYLSDTFGQSYGDEGLRYALLCISGVSLLSAALYLSARNHVLRDCAQAGA